MQRARYGNVQTSHLCVYVCAYIIYTYIHTYTYIVYTQVIRYHTCMYKSDTLPFIACMFGWVYTWVWTHMHMYAYADSRFSNRQDMQRLLIKALLCIEKFAARKEVFFTTTWKGQICVWARCVLIQLKKSIMLLFLSSGHSHCHEICIWPPKGLLQKFSETVQKLWTFKCRNKNKFAP